MVRSRAHSRETKPKGFKILVAIILAVVAIAFGVLVFSEMTPPTHKLVLSDFKTWERIRVTKFGFSIELPEDRHHERVSNDQYAKSAGHGLLMFALHPIRSGLGAEDRYLIEAYFLSFSPEQYREMCAREGEGNDHHDGSGATLHLFHNEIKKHPTNRPGRSGVVYRKDFVAPSGQVIVALVERFDYPGADSLCESDERQITRMLDSVAFQK